MNGPVFICFDDTPPMHHSVRQARCDGCGQFLKWEAGHWVCSKHGQLEW